MIYLQKYTLKPPKNLGVDLQVCRSPGVWPCCPCHLKDGSIFPVEEFCSSLHHGAAATQQRPNDVTRL